MTRSTPSSRSSGPKAAAFKSRASCKAEVEASPRVGCVRYGGRVWWGCGRGLRLFGAEHLKDFAASPLQRNARVHQHLSPDALLLPQDPEEEVLGPHVRMIQLARLHHREFENLLGAGCVGQVWPGRRGCLPRFDRLLDLRGNLFQVDVEVGQ